MTTAGVPPSSGGLKRTLGPVMLWGLGVGYVISGEYFGWNLGLAEGGTYGMLAATLVITLMYLGFVLSYAELSCAMPNAGGVFVYARRAFGPLGGFVAGLVQVIEFVFAPPAIAAAIAAYIGTRVSNVPADVIAIAAYFVFTGINMVGVRLAATFELVVTVLAVLELLVFIGVTAPHVEMANFHVDALPNGWGGAFAAIPFAVWFYLAIEGVANAAEEARDPQRTVAIGFVSAIGTLVVLALLVFFCSVGVAGWKAVVYNADGSTSDAPLPMAIGHVVGTGSMMYTLLVGVGLLGLVASFHGIILAAGRATMELGRSGFFPRRLGDIHHRTHTPMVALSVNLLIGVVAILSGKTAEIITLACFGALALYILSMAALFRLRHIEPNLERPFKAVGYPLLPAITLVIATVALVAVTITNPAIAAVFVGLLALGLGYFFLIGKRAAEHIAAEDS